MALTLSRAICGSDSEQRRGSDYEHIVKMLVVFYAIRFSEKERRYDTLFLCVIFARKCQVTDAT